MREEFFIGLMSGTSLDGIDAVLVGFENANKIRLIETHFFGFQSSLREKIHTTAQNNTHLLINEDSELHQELSPVYAQACDELLSKANIDRNSIRAIANHGQTVKHEPNATPPYSLQLGDGQLIANLTNIKTICQFRQADLAAGGQGAPLMPAFHASVFGPRSNTFVLNIGGIANLTHLGSSVIGFDTGPGNVLLDQWIEVKQNKRFDEDGSWAASGSINLSLLKSLLNDEFFIAPFPKSTGTDYFNIAWVESRYPELDIVIDEDVQATFLALTVESIAVQIERLSPSKVADLCVCGGGANNDFLMQSLSRRLPSFKVQKTDAKGVAGDWLEAIGFAWLGYCHEHGITSNEPSVTGANSKVVLGQAFAPQGMRQI